MAAKFQVGDIVEFWTSWNEYWQGGKAEVTRNTKDLDGYIEVMVMEPIPMNPRNTQVGAKIREEEKNLRLLVDPIESPTEDVVGNPSHYGGKDNPYEVIKVAEAWRFDEDAYLFNVLKYIARADSKGTELQDYKKARYYLDRKISRLEEAK